MIVILSSTRRLLQGIGYQLAHMVVCNLGIVGMLPLIADTHETNVVVVEIIQTQIAGGLVENNRAKC